MKVTPTTLKNTPVKGLRAIESRPQIGVTRGEILGYWCSECQRSDETFEQILHSQRCLLAGRHGRDVYGDDLGPIDRNPAGELRPDTHWTILRWGTSDPPLNVYDGDIVAFRCDECGALNDHLFEPVHDAACRLAGTEFGPLVDISDY